MRCPNCQNELSQIFHEGTICFECQACGGRGVTMGALRNLCGDQQFINLLWRTARYGFSESGRNCSHCGQPMRTVSLPLDGQGIELDVCSRCEIIWFDPSEFERLPKPAPVYDPEADLPPEAKEVLAMKYIELEEKRINSALGDSNSEHEPDEWWKTIPALLGMPVEKYAEPVKCIPFITWGLTAVCVLVYLLTFSNLHEITYQWGFIPNEWLRHGGLTVITSAFLHAGFFHLLGNMYFLMVFGDNVESELGYLKYIGLIVASLACSLLLHTLIDLRSGVPLVGASGFISGIIACYAFSFPKVKLCFMMRWGFFIRWFSMPAWFAFVLWMLLQGLFSYISIGRTGGGVAYLAHIGGAIAGILYVAFHKMTMKSEYRKWEDSINRDAPVNTFKMDDKTGASNKDYAPSKNYKDDFYRMD